jgi:alpha-glucosidase
VVKPIYLLTLLSFLFSFTAQSASVHRTVSGKNVLSIELLNDDLIHVEWAVQENASSGRIYTSPMVLRNDHRAKPVPVGGNVLNTKNLSLRIDTTTLCIKVTDIRNKPEYLLSEFCPTSTKPDQLSLQFNRENFYHVYGLGQQHRNDGEINGELSGKRRTPGNEFGNQMVAQGGGAVGNTQIPVAYFLGQGMQNYGLFLDSPYAQTWDFSSSKYKVSTAGDALRVYILGADNLQNLRANYLDLTGRPPIPPRKMFGFWMSEYGFDSWKELDTKLNDLRSAKFPVDGAFLDLQWFGGVQQNSDNTKMGSMRWDKANFPNAKNQLREYKDKHGIGVIAIEEPYLGKRLPEYLTMATKGYLVRQCPYPCDPIYLDSNPWWGKGGMLDYTNLEGANFWHDWRREQLIKDGIMGHWTDLGEPEQFDVNGWYAGVNVGNETQHGQRAVHNLYNLFWSQSITEGYERNKHSQRPFILSRSGTAGSQRFSTALWSGDIGSNLKNLAGHINTQMNMSLSGFDYYGSDIGGFHRKALGAGNKDEMYTQWLAVSAAIDIPMRAHTENLCNCKETSPAKIGDTNSNREIIRQRYGLTPYYYSLAHEAYQKGTAIFPPMVYHYQDDPGVRTLANQKMIGDRMLVATVAEAGAKDILVYLPKGEWVDFYDHERYQSAGEWFGPFPLYRKGLYRLPTFVKAGHLIPQYVVDDTLLNIDGLRTSGEVSNTLQVVAYLGDGKHKNKFTLYEDDGESIGYQKNEVITTDLIFKQKANSAEITIAEGRGRYDGMKPGRDVNVLFITQGQNIASVTYRDERLQQLNTMQAYNQAERGWFQDGEKVYAKVGTMKLAFVNHIEIRWR